jgi:flagellar biosynthesis GTPase FlhF
MNEKKNINEADIAAVARIRKLIDQQSDIEDKIELFAAEAQNLNDPQKLFTNFDKIIKDLKRRLARLNAIFPTLNPVLDIVGRTNRLGIDDAGDIDDAESAIDRLSLDEEASSEADRRRQERADRRRQERARRRVRRRTRSILQNISFEDYIKKMGKIDYAKLAREVEKSLLEGFTGLARRRIDPVVFFERNPSVVSDVRGIYQILSLANAIGIAVEDFRVKLRSAYADEGDADAFINRILTTDNQLLTDFRKEFAEIDFPELVKKQKRNFNDRFLVKLQGLSDVAAGSKQAADRQRRGELEAIAQASRKKKLREALLKEDEDLEAAMRELQSNPATATEQEISQMMRGEIPRAATASELSDLRGIINSLITSYGSLNNWREEQSNNFKNRFIDLAKSDVQRATSQLEQVLNILLEQMTDILDDTLQNWSDKLIKFRSDKVIPAIIKARNENDEAMLNKTKAYNRELSKVLIDLSDIRKKFISKHKKIISEKPELYKIFLQTAESKLDITVKQRVNEFLENFAKIKSGEEPADPTPSETESSDSLKDMPADKIYVALNQLANKGISADILINQFEDAIAKMYEDAGPLKNKFKEEDEPIILKIKNELARILDGDFSNLINENKILLHPVTYNLILRAYNNLIQEALMGSMPERYINAIYQWLLLQ